MGKRVDHAAVIDLSNDGLTIPEIAKRLGCGLRTVSSIRRSHGFRSPQFLSPERLQVIESMLDDGMSYNEIHRTIGTDPGTIAIHFPGRGWTPSQNGTFNAHTRSIRPKLGART